MLEATLSPGSRTTTLLLLLALQSSLDHTWYPPELISSSLALGPTSRLHATSPLLMIVRVRRGVEPTGYVDESVVASTVMAESTQSTGSASAGEDAAALDESPGAAVAEAEASSLVPEAGDDPPPSSEPSSHQTATTRVMTTRMMAARRIQYTDAGSGPEGCMNVLTGSTVLRGPFERATIRAWRQQAEHPWTGPSCPRCCAGSTCTSVLCRGARRPPGGSWSANSCCSRRRSTGSFRPGAPGWSAGPNPPIWPAQASLTPFGSGGGSATPDAHVASMRARSSSETGTAARFPTMPRPCGPSPAWASTPRPPFWPSPSSGDRSSSTRTSDASLARAVAGPGPAGRAHHER